MLMRVGENIGLTIQKVIFYLLYLGCYMTCTKVLKNLVNLNEHMEKWDIQDGKRQQVVANLIKNKKSKKY